MSELKFKALFSCRNNGCQREVSYHADMLGIMNGELICEECYDEERKEGDPEWSELPTITLDMVVL